MDMHDLSGKLAVITGGSSGIGFSTALLLAKRGARILIVARNEIKLAEAQQQLSVHSQYPVVTLSADISQAEDIKKLAEEVHQLAPCADIIINSAGIVSAGLLGDTPLDEWERLYSLNVRGLVGVLQALTPAMEVQAKKDKKARHIVNVASVAGIVGFPGMSAYSATKGAVILLTESLRAELSVYNIGVSAICPAFVKTPISETVQAFGRMDNPKTYRGIAKTFAQADLTPQDVAGATIKAMAKNKGLVVLGRVGKIANLVKRISPKIMNKIVNKQARVY